MKPDLKTKLSPGKVLARRYELVAALGQGASGVVWLANDRMLGKIKVALKIFPDSIKTNNRLKKRLATEVRAANRVENPNIVKFYNLINQPELLAIVMEYVPGHSLRKVLVAEGAFSFIKATNLLGQIAFALSEIHRRGVVHRDLKPENIIITPDNLAKITDFGIASLLNSYQTTRLPKPDISCISKRAIFDRITQIGALAGTLEYLSPEYITTGEFDERADIYALGVIAYELLSGRDPYVADNPSQLLIKKCDEDPPDLATLRSNCPDELKEICKKAMERDPEKRYQNSDELFNELRLLEAKLLNPLQASIASPELPSCALSNIYERTNSQGFFSKLRKCLPPFKGSDIKLQSSASDRRKSNIFMRRCSNTSPLAFFITLVLLLLPLLGLGFKDEISNLIKEYQSSASVAASETHAKTNTAKSLSKNPKSFYRLSGSKKKEVRKANNKSGARFFAPKSSKAQVLKKYQGKD